MEIPRVPLNLVIPTEEPGSHWEFSVTGRIRIERETSTEVLCAEMCIFWVLSERNAAPDLAELNVS